MEIWVVYETLLGIVVWCRPKTPSRTFFHGYGDWDSAQLIRSSLWIFEHAEKLAGKYVLFSVSVISHKPGRENQPTEAIKDCQSRQHLDWLSNGNQTKWKAPSKRGVYCRLHCEVVQNLLKYFVQPRGCTTALAFLLQSTRDSLAASCVYWTVLRGWSFITLRGPGSFAKGGHFPEIGSLSPWRGPATVALWADWLFGTEHKETVAKDEQDELTQLLKYEKHELSKRNSGPGSSTRWCFSISSFHSTRIYSLLCSDQWIRIAMRDYSRRSRHWNAGTSSVAAEKGEGWGSFLSWVVLLWGVELKNLKGLWGLALKCLLSAAKLPPPPSPPPPPPHR